MEPKAIRVISKPRVLEAPYQLGMEDDGTREESPAPVKKSVETYEQRISKMTNRQLRHEVQKGIKGELTGYRAVAESVVLDVLLESFKNGMKPFVS
jgi:hypothetical protein